MIVALKPIEKGEQINIQYSIENQEYFDCFCSSCNNDIEGFKKLREKALNVLEELKKSELSYEQKKEIIKENYKQNICSNLSQFHLQAIEELYLQQEEINEKISLVKTYVKQFESYYQEIVTPKLSEVYGLLAELLQQQGEIDNAIEVTKQYKTLRTKFNLPINENIHKISLNQNNDPSQVDLQNKQQQ